MARPVALALVLIAAIAGAVLYWRAAPVPPPAVAAFGVPVEVPSGQPVAYVDTVQNIPGEGLVYRFRFVAPGIARNGGTVDAATVQTDMQYLCDSFAIPRIASTGPQPSQIVISLSDRPVKFGVPSPEATQFFEGYRIEAGTCIWELF
jgi:hypothetical protein